MSKKLKIHVVGTSSSGALEISYLNALKKTQNDISFFDYPKELNKYVKGGHLGRMIHRFLPVEQWVRKMNRKLIVEVKEKSPDVIFFFAKAKILFGTLACIKTINPNIRVIWIWPDTPMNLERYNLENAPFVDHFFTYSSETLNVFRALGYQNVHFLPLGGDLEMHGKNEEANIFDVDLGFVGGWRPERERAILQIHLALPEIKIGIHGPNWGKMMESKILKKFVLSDGLYKGQLADFFNTSRINLNVIDDTNYPAANMRFFEIPAAFGLQLSSTCPEMESIFKDGESNLYFLNEEELIEKTKWALANPALAHKIRVKAHTLVSTNHSYDSRVHSILQILTDELTD